ncbi:hypothetical protein [Pseudomonas sp. TE21394]
MGKPLREVYVFWLLTYVSFAAFCYIIHRLVSRPLFVRTKSHHFPWKINYSVRYWGVQQWLALTISLCLLCVLGLLVLHYRGFDIKVVGRWFLLGLSLCSLWLAVVRLKLVEVYRLHKGWLAASAAVMTLGLGMMASAEADGFILYHTRVTPGNFPVGQKILTLAWLAYIWYWGVSLLVSVVILLGAVLGMFALGITSSPYRHPAAIDDSVGFRPNKRYHEDGWVGMTLLVGLIYTAISVTSLLLESAGPRLRGVQHELLIYADFHLQPEDCGMMDLPRGTQLAAISAKEVVVAQPDKGGYTYETRSCTIKSLAEVKEVRELYIRQARARDNYF